MKSCKEMNQLVSLYIENELSGTELAEFEAHIRECEACTKEINDIKAIICLCKDMPEEELPENFKDKLHEKLLKEKKNSRFILFKNGYIKSFSAVAAGILLIISVNGILNGGLFSNKKGMTGHIANSEATASDEMNLKQGDSGNISRYYNDRDDEYKNAVPENIPAEGQTSTLAAPDEKDVTIEFDEEVVPKDNTHDYAITSTPDRGSSGDLDASRMMQGPGKKTSSLSEAFRSSPKQKHSLINKNVSINAYVDVIDTRISDIKALASAYEVKNTDSCTIMYDAPAESPVPDEDIKDNGSGEEKGPTMASAAPENITLTFRIPEESYQEFVNSLREISGLTGVSVANIEEYDSSGYLSRLNRTLYEENRAINEYLKRNGSSDTPEIKHLIEKRDKTQAEIDKVKADAKIIVVTIVLSVK